MRLYVAVIGIVLFTTGVVGQEETYYFDGNDQTSLIFPGSDTSNVWQIGPPDKSLLSEAYSLPNAIITDTLIGYPSSDTSQFIVTLPWINGLPWLILHFKYKIDSDTLTDFGKIEATTNINGPWYDVLHDTVGLDISWHVTENSQIVIWSDSVSPFSGTQSNWRHFNHFISNWDQVIGPLDTVYYRFSFISDSIDSGKEGWMIDNIHVTDFFSSIIEHDFNSLARISPNPTSGQLNISLLDQAVRIEEILVHDVQGRELIRNSPNVSNAKLEVSELPQGVYLLQITTTERKRSTTRFVKE